MFCLSASRIFIFSGLTFRSLIHFEFIFVYGVRKCSGFIFLQVVDQFSQHHLFKSLSLPHCLATLEVRFFTTAPWGKPKTINNNKLGFALDDLLG